MTPRHLKLMDARPFMPAPGQDFDYVTYTRVVKQAWAMHVVLRGGVIVKVEPHKVEFGGIPSQRFRLMVRRNPRLYRVKSQRVKPREYVFIDVSKLQFRIIKSFCCSRFS